MLLHGELVVGVFFLAIILLVLTFLLVFVLVLNLIELLVINTFLADLIIILSLHLVFLVDVFLDLIGSSLHLVLLHLFFFDPLHTFHLLHTSALRTTLLHQGLSIVLRGKVRSGDVQTIVVLSRDQKLTLLISEMFVGVVTSLAQKSNEVLEFLDLIQIVDEGLGDLLDK